MAEGFNDLGSMIQGIVKEVAPNAPPPRQSSPTSPRGRSYTGARQEQARSPSNNPVEVEAPRGTVLVYPVAGLSPSDKGLIPATDSLPAKIVIKGAKPYTMAEWTIRRDGAYLKAGAKKGETIVTQTDGKGDTESLFFYNGGPLSGPTEFEVTTMIAERKHSAFVSVGLGLAFDKVKAIQGQSVDNRTHAFTLSVKSVWRPKMNVQIYLKNAEESNTWGSKRFGIRVETNRLNNNGGEDQQFRGTTEIKPMASGNGLTATDKADPTYGGGYYKYPAVIMGSDGQHTYSIVGTPVVMDYSGNVTVGQKMFEPLSNNKGMVVISSERPESMLQSLSCSFEPQGWTQYLMLESAKALPGGKGVEWFVATTSLICGMTKGDYEKSILDMANFVGGEYLSHLNKAEVFKNLSDKQKKAVKTATEAYNNTNNRKSNEEKEKYAKEALRDFGLMQPETIEAGAEPEKLPNTNTPVESPTNSMGKVKDVEDSVRDLTDSVKQLFNK